MRIFQGYRIWVSPQLRLRELPSRCYVGIVDQMIFIRPLMMLDHVSDLHKRVTYYIIINLYKTVKNIHILIKVYGMIFVCCKSAKTASKKVECMP